MNDRVVAFAPKLNELFSDVQYLSYITRTKELQVDALEVAEQLLKEASSLKQEMITASDEEAANAMLSCEEFISALVNVLQMWIALKEEQPNAAWDFLINAQGAVRAAIHASEVMTNIQEYAEQLYIYEQVLFPRQIFLSIGAVTEQSNCSICGGEYGECGHIKGRAYMGQMCYEAITKTRGLREVSIVSEPANKHCRIFQWSYNGQARDCLTGEIVQPVVQGPNPE